MHPSRLVDRPDKFNSDQHPPLVLGFLFVSCWHSTLCWYIWFLWCKFRTSWKYLRWFFLPDLRGLYGVGRATVMEKSGKIPVLLTMSLLWLWKSQEFLSQRMYFLPLFYKLLLSFALLIVDLLLLLFKARCKNQWLDFPRYNVVNLKNQVSRLL